MLKRGKMDRDVVEIVGIDSLVPKEHLLRKIDKAVDFNRLYEMVEPLYCEDNGRPSIDPVVLFKMVLIQHLYGLPSLRRTAEEVSGSISIISRFFLSINSGREAAPIPKTVLKQYSGISGKTTRTWQTTPATPQSTRTCTSGARRPLNGSLPTPRKNMPCAILNTEA